MSHRTFLTVVADEQGEVFELPELLLAGMNGYSVVRPEEPEMIPLPSDSRLFTIPHTPPVGFDPKTGKQKTVERLPAEWRGKSIQAVSAFLSPGFTRTLLPAADYQRKRMMLPLWSYTAVGWCVEEECFYTAAVQVDRNTQWQAKNFDDRLLEPRVNQALGDFPDNRLIEQLARCALDYHCFAAKNLFLRRWEAPLPCSPVCNSRCLGCISLQESDCCPASQERLSFVPTVGELCEIAVPHLETAENAIVSFGQGCEGDPILQVNTVSSAIRRMRKKTSRGTININTNASIPKAVSQLAEAGIDSIRVSLNSAQEAYYNAYYRPMNYRFSDVLESLRIAKQAGLYVMLNYLVFPGVTDQDKEFESLARLIGDYGVDMIQLRNLSMDPTVYLASLELPSSGFGVLAMLQKLKSLFPELQYGYFNRTRETFFPAGYATEWPI
ncbi:MAG: radical SAM protein [Deltaproteobacteria bacterium]|nr:radical SAM protein [Deltaproteobacteria bacterium]